MVYIIHTFLHNNSLKIGILDYLKAFFMFIRKTIMYSYQKMFNIKFVQLFKNYNFYL